ncbi:MAG: methyl-accepting chemotaxis protein [Pseudanabaenaceae cyanobacterium]
MLGKLRLRGKILAGYSVPIAICLTAVGLITYELNNALQSRYESTKAANLSYSMYEYSLRVSYITYEQATLILSDGSYTPSLQNIEKYTAELRQELENVRKIIGERPNLPKFSEIAAKFARIEELYEPINKFDQRLLNLIKTKKIAEARKLWFSDELVDIFVEYDKLIKELIALSREASVLEREQIVQAVSRSFIYAAIAFGLIVIASPVVSNVIAQSIATGVTKTIGELASTISQIAASMAEQEKVISQQAVSVNQTTTTMEELGASSRQSAEQAIASSTNAQKSLELCNTGSQSVQQTLEGISTVKDKVTAIAEKIVQLSEQTAQISTVSDLVADIANQTNILALNAAVEAARAGEQGKGFAVVAQEVRKLADQSKTSAEKISNLIREIQSSINATVMVTDEGTKTANESMRLAQETLQSFEGIVKAVETIAVNTQQIALSSKQQAVGVQQAVSAMNAINLGAKEASASVAQVKAAIQQLSESTQLLQQQI